MQLIKQSEATAARRTVYFMAANSADDSPYTSTLSGADLQVSKAGAAEANSAGTATHLGDGLFAYAFTTGELDTLGPVSVRIDKSGVWTDAVIAQVVPFDPYSSSSLGLSNLDAAVSTRLAEATYEAPSTLLTEADGVETGYTLQGAMRLMLAALVGRRSGVNTGTEIFRDVGNTKNRISVTFDSNGNVTTVTYDAT